MSVLKSKRGLSELQFLDTARDLEIFTLKQALKFPKRYTFFITTEVVRLAQQAYNDVKSANSIFPTLHEDYLLRREYLTKAYCNLQALLSQLSIAKELNFTEIKATAWQRWLDLVEEELKLISSVKKSDKERFGKL